jgi:hypothetical protein
MSNTTTTASTGVCQWCQAKLTHVLTVDVLDSQDEPPNRAPFSCPQCGHAGTVAVLAGRRIVRIDTRRYLDPL